MASESEAIRRMREICLSLPDAREGSHFRVSAFRAGGKMFATCGVQDGMCRIVVQLEPAHAKELLSSDPRFRRYPLAPHCVQIAARDVKEWGEVRELVRESYRLNVPGKRAGRPKARKERA